MNKFFLCACLLIAMNAQAQLVPQLATDIQTGAPGGNPYMMTVFNNTLYFSANSGGKGNELHRYSGGTAATLVYDLYPGVNSAFSASTGFQMGVLNNKLFFYGSTASIVNGCFVYTGSGSPTQAFAD